MYSVLFSRPALHSYLRLCDTYSCTSFFKLFQSRKMVNTIHFYSLILVIQHTLTNMRRFIFSTTCVLMFQLLHRDFCFPQSQLLRYSGLLLSFVTHAKPAPQIVTKNLAPYCFAKHTFCETTGPVTFVFPEEGVMLYLL